MSSIRNLVIELSKINVESVGEAVELVEAHLAVWKLLPEQETPSPESDAIREELKFLQTARKNISAQILNATQAHNLPNLDTDWLARAQHNHKEKGYRIQELNIQQGLLAIEQKRKNMLLAESRSKLLIMYLKNFIIERFDKQTFYGLVEVFEAELKNKVFEV